MASNFMGGFAKGFNQSYQQRRAEDRALQNDLFRDTWSRYHNSLEKRNAQKKQEDVWSKNADMLAQNDGEKQVFMNLFKSGMSFQEVQDWQKEYVVGVNEPTPETPKGPRNVNQFTPEGPEGLEGQELNLTQADFSDSGRSPFASPSNQRISSKQNRAIEQVAKRTGADPEEVRRVLYGGNNNAPVDFIDVTIKPRSPREMAYMDEMTIEDIDDARKIAIRNRDNVRLKQLDALRKVKEDEEKHRATRFAVGEETKFQKRDADGNMMTIEGTMNEDGWVRLKQPDGTLSEPKQISELGDTQPIRSSKPQPKGMTEEQLFQKRNDVQTQANNYREMLRITRATSEIIEQDPTTVARVNEYFKAVNMYALEVETAMKRLGLPWADAMEEVANKYNIEVPPGTSLIQAHMEDYTYARLGINDQSGRDASNVEVDRGLLRLMKAGPDRIIPTMLGMNERGRAKTLQAMRSTTSNLGPKYAEYWEDGWATADPSEWLNTQVGDELLTFSQTYSEEALLKQKREARQQTTNNGILSKKGDRVPQGQEEQEESGWSEIGGVRIRVKPGQ